MVSELLKKVAWLSNLHKELSACKDMEGLNKIGSSFYLKHIEPLSKIAIEARKEKKFDLILDLHQQKSLLDSWLHQHKLKILSPQYNYQDLSTHNHNLSYISRHLTSSVKDELLELFNRLSFNIEYESDIVDIEDNFDNLLVPKDHPSRETSETFYISNKKVLRTHCTGNSVKKLKLQKNKEAQYKLVTIGSVYRNDDVDSRHLFEFNQIDIVWIDKGLSVSNLKWLIITIVKHILGPDIEYRFRRSYFPFTQPSYELDIKCMCNGEDECKLCGGALWIELLGCGLFHREIMNNCGYSEDTDALAAGIGIERLVMFKYKIIDIRETVETNFKALKHDC